MPNLPDWTVYVGAPRAAILHPVHETDIDLDDWARNAVLERLVADAPKDAVEAAADVLRAAAEDSRTRDLILAFSFSPEPARGELARIQVSGLAPDRTYPVLDLDTLTEWLARPVAESFRPAEVARGEVPMGPYVRVRHDFLTDVATETGDGTVMQTVAYAVRPPEIDWAVVLHTSWRSVAYRDKLYDLADRLAESLRLVPKG